MASSHVLLQPYRPTAQDPFDAVKAAHLYNRAGFGGKPEEIQAAVADGPGRSVEKLLAFPAKPAEEQGSDVPNLAAIKDYPADFRELRQLMAAKTEQERKELRQKLAMANREAVQAIVNWWLGRMARGPYPLQEKLTLFWHGHFTTSAREERSALLMWRQNELLRADAAGNFQRLLFAISRDPAMLDYLNNQQNRKAHPNENFARELMELFTLGIGQYSETDVKEAARAFTGWAHDGDDYVFRRGEHDFGTKRFLGQSGAFGGEDILGIILRQPACPRFVAEKLFRFFVYDEIDEPLGKALGEVLRQNNYDLRPLLSTILQSKAFYSAKAIGAQIKSPIQLVTGTARLLDMDLPADRRIMGALTQMGQVPLMPPNVKGWPGGRMWINTSTLFVRNNTLIFLSGGPAIGGRGARARPAAPRFALELKGGSADDLVDRCLARLIQRPVDPDKRKVLIDAVGSRTDDPQVVRQLVQLILSMPEYQLC